MKRLWLAVLTICIVSLLFGCPPKYSVNTSGMTPQQAKVAQLKAKVLEGYDWLGSMKQDYINELTLRPVEMRQTIHKEVKPVLTAVTAALDSANVALGVADGATGEKEFEEFLRLKTQLINVLAKYLIKLSA